MLDKISKLLTKAENAGTAEEAATFMAKAQEMASINGIDLAIARMHQAKRERVQEPEERKIQVNPYTRRHNRKHFMELAMAIAEVNDVQYLIGGREYHLHAVGFPSDLDVVEALYAHLAVQMAVECDEALRRGEHKEVRPVLVTKRVEIPWEDREWGQWNGKQYYDDNPDDEVYLHQFENESQEDFERRRDEAVGRARQEYLDAVRDGDRIYSVYSRDGMGGYRKPVPPPAYDDEPVLDADGKRQYEEKEVSVVDGRVFRNSFYEAFVIKMRGRLWEARRAAERDRGIDVAKDSETALALRDKKAEVDQAHENQRAKVGHLGVYQGAASDDRKTDHTMAGYRAGAKSAERVPIASGREVGDG